MKILLTAIALSASMACGARPKPTPNDEVTSPLTIEDEEALEDQGQQPTQPAPPPNTEAEASP
jgi:hypothetical protein